MSLLSRINVIYTALLLFFIFSYSVASLKIIPEIKTYYFFFKNLSAPDLALVFLILSLMSSLGFMSTTFISFFGGFILGYTSLWYILPSYFLAQFAGYGLGYLLPGGSKAQGFLIEKFQAIVASPAQFVFWARLSPFLPFAALNIFCGMRRLNLKAYLIAGIAGMLPRSIFMVSLGIISDNLIMNEQLRTWQWYWLCASAAVSVLGIWFSLQILPKNK